MANSRALPESLARILKSLPKIALAFSGGVDSRFLAHSARICGCELIAINAFGPHIPGSETEYARSWATRNGFNFRSIHYDPLALPEIRANSRERCYVCKKGLLKRIGDATETNWTICDGGNADDQKAFRPGLRAVAEAGVISPLALASLGKAEIRKLALITGLDNPMQPSKACLLSRVNYGIEPGHELLQRIANCEEEIQEFLTRNGLTVEFRVRLRPEPLLQISGAIAADKDEFVKIMARHGFPSAEILQTESISGFFDKPGIAMLH